MPKGQTKSRSMLLALIAVVVFFSGFAAVYLVEAAWERQAPETIVISDATAVPLNQKMDGIKRTYVLKNYTGSYSYDSYYNGTYNTTELTPVYSLDENWTYSLGTLKPHPTGDLDPVGGATRMYFMFRIPNIDTFLVNSIYVKVNFTSTVGIASRQITIGGMDPAITLPDPSDSDHLYQKHIFVDTDVSDTPTDDYTFDVNVPLSESIDIFQNVNNGKDEGFIFITFAQVDNSGWDPLAAEVHFEINGTYIDTTDKVNAVAWSLGGAAFMCSLTAIFMTDSVDLKDILKGLKG